MKFRAFDYAPNKAVNCENNVNFHHLCRSRISSSLIHTPHTSIKQRRPGDREIEKNATREEFTAGLTHKKSEKMEFAVPSEGDEGLEKRDSRGEDNKKSITARSRGIERGQKDRQLKADALARNGINR